MTGQNCNVGMMCFALHDLLYRTHCEPQIPHPPTHNTTALEKIQQMASFQDLCITSEEFVLCDSAFSHLVTELAIKL